MASLTGRQRGNPQNTRRAQNTSQTSEHNFSPDKHNALENANFSRTASCWSIWSLRIKLPCSSLVFPLQKRVSNLTESCRTSGISNEENMTEWVNILSYGVINLFILPVDQCDFIWLDLVMLQYSHHSFHLKKKKKKGIQERTLCRQVLREKNKHFT